MTQLSQKNREDLQTLKTRFNQSFDLTIPREIKKAINDYNPNDPSLDSAVDLCKAILNYKPLLPVKTYSFMDSLDDIPLVKHLLLFKEIKEDTPGLHESEKQGTQLLSKILEIDSPAVFLGFMKSVLYECNMNYGRSESPFLAQNSQAYLNLFFTLPGGVTINPHLMRLFISAQRHLAVENIDNNFQEFWKYTKGKTIEAKFFQGLWEVAPEQRQNCFLFTLKTGYFGPWQGISRFLSESDTNNKLLTLYKGFGSTIISLLEQNSREPTPAENGNFTPLLMQSTAIWPLLDEQIHHRDHYNYFDSPAEPLSWMIKLLIFQKQSPRANSDPALDILHKIEPFVELLRHQHYHGLRLLVPTPHYSPAFFTRGYNEEIIKNGQIVYSRAVPAWRPPETDASDYFEALRKREKQEEQDNKIIDQYLERLKSFFQYGIRTHEGYLSVIDVILIIDQKGCLNSLENLTNFGLLLKRLEQGDVLLSKLAESMNCTQDDLPEKLQSLSTEELQTVIQQQNDVYLENQRRLYGGPG